MGNVPSLEDHLSEELAGSFMRTSGYYARVILDMPPELPQKEMNRLFVHYRFPYNLRKRIRKIVWNRRGVKEGEMDGMSFDSIGSLQMEIGASLALGCVDKRIRTLTLMNCHPCGDLFWIPMFTITVPNNKLTALHFSNCDLSSKKATVALKEALSTSPFLITLHISETSIGREEGLQDLAEGILVGRSLKDLSLMEVNMGIEGMLVVVDMLCDDNCPLDRFSTGRFFQYRGIYSIEDEDLRRLVKGCSLKHLCLAYDNFDVNQCEVIASGLGENGKIEEICFTQSQAVQNAIGIFEDILTCHPTLEYVGLMGDYTNPSDREQLMRLRDKNKEGKMYFKMIMHGEKKVTAALWPHVLYRFRDKPDILMTLFKTFPQDILAATVQAKTEVRGDDMQVDDNAQMRAH